MPDRTEQVRVRIKNIPLSADDSIIVKTLKDSGCELAENPSREKLRVDGKLTNCELDDRIVYIKPPKEPLPKVIKMGIFRAKGQLTQGVTLTPMPPGSPKNHRKADRNCQS